MADRTSGVAAPEAPSITDEQIDAIWASVPPQGDPTGRKFARAFARALLSASVVKAPAYLSPEACMRFADAHGVLASDPNTFPQHTPMPKR